MNMSTWQVPKHQIVELKRKSTKYCLCIPIINEGERFRAQLSKLKPYSNQIDVIICDGGSTDGSTNEVFLKDQGVRTLLVKQDSGKLSAQLRMGYSYALSEGYEGVITIDGNGKDGVETVPRFIDKLDEGFDYVQGSRYAPGGEAINTPLLRHVANRFVHAPLLSLAAGYYWFTDTTNGYRAYSSKYLLDERVQPFRNIFDTYELLAYLTVRASQIGLKVCQIPVRREYPKNEVPTKISFWKGNLNLIKILISCMFGTYNTK